MERTASVEWNGSLRDGQGRIESQSGAFTQIPYSYRTRFEQQVGTNPEELIAAAHAGCFTMALAGILGKAGHQPTRLHTNAAVRLEKSGDGWAITHIQLSTYGDVPGVSEDEFRRAAEQAKAGCPVSRALQQVPMGVEASLIKAQAA